MQKSWLQYYSYSAGVYNSGFLDAGMQTTITIDCANGIAEANDYTAILVIATNGLSHWLINIVRQKLHYPALRKLAEELIKKYKPRNILIENAGNGTSLIQELKYKGFTGVVEIKPRIDKVSRFNACLTAIEHGALFLPDTHPELMPFVDELCSFPFVKHDDQVDALSQYFSWCITQKSMQTGSHKHNLPRLRKL